MLPAEDTKGLPPKPINTLETHPSLTVCVVTSPTSQPVSPKNSTLSELGIDADEGIEEGVDDEEFNLDRGQLGSQSKYVYKTGNKGTRKRPQLELAGIESEEKILSGSSDAFSNSAIVAANYDYDAEDLYTIDDIADTIVEVSTDDDSSDDESDDELAEESSIFLRIN